MKRVLITLIFETLLASVMFEACSKMPKDSDVEDDAPAIKVGNVSFAAKSSTFDGMQLLWREALINKDKPGEPVLVLYLHGGSAKGSDNEKQLRGDEIGTLGSYLERKGMKAIFIVPQCLMAYSWGDKMNGVLASMIDSYGLDALYGFGGSMGGTGLGSLVSTYPEKFTAAMLVAWSPRMATVESMAKVPFRTVMGTKDALMDASAVESFVEEVKSAGGKSIYELVSGWTHGQTCTLSYTDDRLDWVFSQK